MELVYFPANQAYVFTFFTVPVSLEGHQRFWPVRGEAVAAARMLGLEVRKNGKVAVIG